MALQIRRIQVWACEISDRPGAAAAKLAYLAEAGADLEFVFTRPTPTKIETSTLFLAPILGPPEIAAAKQAGLAPAATVAMLCVEGDNRPSVGFDIMSRLAIANINVRGISVSQVAGRFAAYLAFDDPDTATLAVQVLATLEE